MPPKLIIFDLDYTLWPFYVDTHVTPPFRKESSGRIVDRHGKKIDVYPDVPSMLQNLRSQNYQLGIASRTDDPEAARQLVTTLDWNKYFQYQEIYPGCKVTHFSRFAKQSGLPYKQMLFFDDEMRNIRDVSKLGVTCIHVPDGMNLNQLELGLRRFMEGT